jgi:ATP-dependent DNA ligase I
MKYSLLAEVYEKLENTSSRLGKVDSIASLLEEAPPELLSKVALLVQGTVFPAWEEKEIGIATQLMVKAIAQASGFPEGEVKKGFSKVGDLGLVIEELVGRKKQRTLLSKQLSVEKVFDNLQRMASVEGKGSVDRKLALVSELITHASPKEAKYIARTTLGTLRIGVAEGVLRDAIAKAFFSDILWTSQKGRVSEIVKDKGKKFLVEKGFLEKLKIEKGGLNVAEKSKEEIEKASFWKKKTGIDYILLLDEKLGSRLKKGIVNAVEMAWFLRPDYGEVAAIAKEKGLAGLRGVSLTVGEPYHVLLAERSPGLEDALKAYDNPALEWKYDGARVSIHKKGEQVWLYTRRLENVTKQFPEVVKWARECIRAKEAIVEGEMLGFSGGRPMPFQFLSQRIKRKYDIEEVAKKIPVQVNLFDVVFLEGKSLFRVPLRERWEKLQGIIKPLKGRMELAKHLVTKDLKKAEVFYEEALKASQEGLIIKNMDALYQPGRRVSGGWLKVKPVLENLDLVVIGATWGTGKRAGWFSSFILGCRDEGGFLECGKIGTGIKEKEGSGVTFQELTKLLKPLITGERGDNIEIRPKIVIEVAYEEIQKSPNYASGYALRFPRVVRIRNDKGVAESDSKDMVERIYRMQKGKS